MSDVYYAIILEFNSQEVKLGFAGEPKEHVHVTTDSREWKEFVKSRASMLPKSTQYPPMLNLGSHSLHSDAHESMVETIASNERYSNLVKRYNNDKNDVRWFDWEEDNYLTLAMLLRRLLSTKCLVSALNCKLFVVDSCLSAASKYLFCQAMLNEGVAVSVSFLPFSPCCCVAAGVENALVIALEWSSCTVVPVADLRAISLYPQPECTGESIHYTQAFLRPRYSYDEISEETLKGTNFFEGVIFGKRGLSSRIAKYVESLSIDSRAPVLANIVITGAYANVPGIKGRLITEISCQLPHQYVCGKVCLGAWAGASLYCSTTLLKESSHKRKHLEITKETLHTKARKELEQFHF